MKTAIAVGISGMDCEALTHLLLSKNYSVIGTYRKNTQLDLVDLISGYPPDSNIHLEYCDISDFNSVRILFEKASIP